MRLLCLLGVIFAAVKGLAASSIFIAQLSTGSNDGSSCSNAHSVSWFNNASNWGSASSQINPGSMIHLCGTVSSDITLQGSGSNGIYTTVDGTGAVYGGTFYTNNMSWWKIQNVTWNNTGPTLISIVGGSNGIFTGNYSDNVSDGPAIFIGQGNTLPDTIVISNNHIRTASTDFGNTQHDILVTEGSTNVLVEHNYLEMRAGGAGDQAHDDCIQTWESGSTSSHGPPANWTIRYNQVVMNSAATNDRSWTMIENLMGTNFIYGNLFLGLNGAEQANGIAVGASGGVYNIFNNTLVALNSASNNMMSLGAGTFNVKNNIVYSASGQTELYISDSSAVVTRDHNLWFGANTPSCTGHTGEICGSDPQFVNIAGSDFRLMSSSPAINSGANLSAYFTYDMNGSVYGADGAFDRGAYEYVGGSPAPTPSPTPTPTPTPTPASTPAPTPSPVLSGETLMSSLIPSGLSNSDGTGVNYELGMKFYSVSDGIINAIRFYKSPSESGTHTGKIYSASGALLASVVFSSETSSGWQQQNLSAPLAISANVTYIVTVNTGNTYYVDTVSGLASQLASANLRTIVGGNGVYGPVGAMPTNSWNDSNYFRDIVFVASSSPSPTPTPTPTPAPAPTTDTQAPVVSITSPVNGATVARSTAVTITANASDNVAVTKVEFYVNGSLKCTRPAAPYSCIWSVPKRTGKSYNLSAKAYDQAGNVGSSQLVSVTSR